MSTNHPSVRTLLHVPPALRWFVACATILLLCSLNVAAQSLYVTDPGFQGGAIAGDAYAANIAGSNQLSTARKVVQAGNGEIIVASLVKKPGGTQTNGLWNLGLARYAENGSRLTWPGVSPLYGHFSDQYVVYPNATGALLRNIRGMVRVESNIAVLVETLTPGGPDLALLVFGIDGSFRASASPFLVEYSEGGDLAHYIDNSGQNQLVVVGNRLTPGSAARSRPVFRRYQLAGAGTLSPRTPTTNLAMPACLEADWECFVTSVVSTTGLFTDSPRIYTAAIYRGPTPGTESAVVARFNQDGFRDIAFNPGNRRINRHDGSAGGTEYTRAIDLGLREKHFPSDDGLFLLAAISRPCRAGGVLVKINHVGDPTFWPRFGGSTQTGSNCASLGRTTDIPTALQAAGERVVAIGYRSQEPLLQGEDVVDGTLTSFQNDLVGGSLTLLERQVFSAPIGGPRELYFTPWAIAIGVGSGRFSVVGSLRHPNRADVPANLRGKYFTAITRFMRQPDAVFADGFEQ